MVYTTSKTEGLIEEKWESYTGTGITAKKGRNALALRKAVGGGEFAIVKLYGGCWSTSRIKVLEEIKTSSLEKAQKRFNVLARELGFELQPLRTASLLIPFFLN